ncbi:NitT/TauT family transport system permease protein [Paenibacillus sp. UNCCL117]|uniref:ABC transporter permease n=1 Tax=unclassified Paenibacillus TaxID=185978 RepID=UPI000889CEDD|nr:MULTISPECIES: ABC transporter permease [unclassified Paenibacillus]SDD17047.1 NitT/TauT family transport system permease protein [Paenibacillus sp. cl123]SFW34874.1 NitT/TauT family transport system permease protein [Paenibacillus sp. UNCCL117]
MGTNRVRKGRPAGVLAGQVALIIALLAVCEWLVRQEIVGSLYLSAPTQVWKEAVGLFAAGGIYTDLLVTLHEFIVGYSISVVSGIAAGMLLVLVPGAERFFRPFLSALMAVPKVTIIPLLMLWLGIGPSHKIAIIVLFCFFTIAFNTITGIKQTQENHLRVARVFEANQLQLIVKVILPSAAPTIFAGLRVSAATGLVGALYGEMIASKNGLGNLLIKATSLYNTAQAFAVIAVVTLVSVGIIWLIDLLEKKVVLKWKSS